MAVADTQILAALVAQRIQTRLALTVADLPDRSGRYQQRILIIIIFNILSITYAVGEGRGQTLVQDSNLYLAHHFYLGNMNKNISYTGISIGQLCVRRCVSFVCVQVCT